MVKGSWKQTTQRELGYTERLCWEMRILGR